MYQSIHRILGRRYEAFSEDWLRGSGEVAEAIRDRSILVIGGAGSIGRVVVRELLARRPARLDVVDLSENALVELVRDLRSSGEVPENSFRTLALDAHSPEMDRFLADGPSHDFVFNLAALKHVRSERDPYTLMRMIVVNVLMTDRLLGLSCDRGTSGFFSVSTDKAVNPANAMGASKRAMELCLASRDDRIRVSSARFANVAFSDGSLLHGFVRRIEKRQPLAGPSDVRRYFITAGEAARLCLMASFLGRSRDCFVPGDGVEREALEFPDLAERFLSEQGMQPYWCESEEEARRRVDELAPEGRWPCYFAPTGTTGEKPVEELYGSGEAVDGGRFSEIRVVRLPRVDRSRVEEFLDAIERMRTTGTWSRVGILDLLGGLVPEFRHRETGSFLDGRM